MPTLLRRALLAALLLSFVPVLVTAQEPSESYPPNAQLVASVESFVKKQELAGAVMLVADKNKVLAVDAVGYADIAEKREMSPDALFWIASQSKSLTAAAFMMLVDEGKVKLDDPVEKYLPEYADAWVAVEKDAKHMLLERPAEYLTLSKSRAAVPSGRI